MAQDCSSIGRSHGGINLIFWTWLWLLSSQRLGVEHCNAESHRHPIISIQQELPDLGVSHLGRLGAQHKIWGYTPGHSWGLSTSVAATFLCDNDRRGLPLLPLAQMNNISREVTWKMLGNQIDKFFKKLLPGQNMAKKGDKRAKVSYLPESSNKSWPV